MTQERLLRLAYIGAVEIWNREDENARDLGYDNTYANERESKAWQELKEIAEMLKEEEN